MRFVVANFWSLPRNPRRRGPPAEYRHSPVAGRTHHTLHRIPVGRENELFAQYGELPANDPQAPRKRA